MLNNGSSTNLFLWANNSFTAEPPYTGSIVAYNQLTSYDGKYIRDEAATNGGSVTASLLAYDSMCFNRSVWL